MIDGVDEIMGVVVAVVSDARQDLTAWARGNLGGIVEL